MGSTPGNSARMNHSIPIDILDDLCSRFIINLPEEDRGDLVRICFQIELAHWFYLDYYVTDETNRLIACNIREFAAHIFQHVPHLREHLCNLEDILSTWRGYKQTVPTYGAIILDTDLTHVLLVQSFWTKASWGFPKGKVNEGEEPWKCAAREVLEETGFDISKHINKNEYIEAMIHEQIVRLYIIGYIPRETKFQPRTRNEIKACEWFALADLPANKKDMTPKVKMGVSPNAFFMVLPFVKRMRRWVSERNPKTYRRTRHKSMGEIESSTGKNKKTISQGLQNEIQEYQQNTGQEYNTNQGHGSHGSYIGHNQVDQNNSYTVNQGNPHHHSGNPHPHVHQGSHHNSQMNPNQQGNSHHNSQINQSQGSSHHGSSATKNVHTGPRKDRKNNTKRQLFTPQNTHTNNFSPQQPRSNNYSPQQRRNVVASPNASSPNAKFQPVQNRNTSTPNDLNDTVKAFFEFVAPSWANFRFDRRAIQECLT